MRVVIADDHPVFREGMANAVRRRPDLKLVAEASDGLQAIEQIRTLHPDVALLDVKLPGLDGVQVMNAAMRQALPTRVLFLSGYVDGPQVYEAVAAGASGFLGKDAPRRVICEAISAVARGEQIFSRETQSGLADQVRIHARLDRAVLTGRELEIVDLMASGQSVHVIAQRLHLSPSTIKKHQQALYEKLGVGTAAAAVATALRRQLLA